VKIFPAGPSGSVSTNPDPDQEKIVRKTFIYCFMTFLSLKNVVNIASKSNKKKTL
jgi:hypothetical protein